MEKYDNAFFSDKIEIISNGKKYCVNEKSICRKLMEYLLVEEIS